MDARIGNHGESLADRLAVRVEDDFILSRRNDGAEDLFARSFAGDGVIGERVLEIFERLAVVAVLQGGGRLEAQIPGETIQAGIFRELSLRAEPVVGNIFYDCIGRGYGAREAAD